MATTIVDTIPNPKYQKEYNFKNIDEKVEICTTLKAMEQEILSCLDNEHQKMFKKYNEAWDKLHCELSVDTLVAGMKLAEGRR